MTTTALCRQIRLDLGVYLLGAIDTADRSAVDAHLAFCAVCRDELVQLAGLPGLLSRVTADDAELLFLQLDDGCRGGTETSIDLGLRLQWW
jgi:predicted anti-sigma-YlaC factor YlaD